MENFSSDVVSLVSLIIDELTKEAISNPVVCHIIIILIMVVLNFALIFIQKVRNNYLTAIDNLQQVDKDTILDSEIQNQSSSRYMFKIK
jgi:hypothetical protein